MLAAAAFITAMQWYSDICDDKFSSKRFHFKKCQNNKDE